MTADSRPERGKRQENEKTKKNSASKCPPNNVNTLCSTSTVAKQTVWHTGNVLTRCPPGFFVTVATMFFCRRFDAVAAIFFVDVRIAEQKDADR
jgi:hypothetical protein